MANRGCWLVMVIVAAVACKKDSGTSAGTAGSSAAGSATAGSSATGSAASGAVEIVAMGSSVTGSAAAGSAAAGSAAVGSAAAGSGSAAVAEGFKVGDAVMGQWTNGNWYPGKIAKINDDGTYRVNYNDGDVSPSLTAKKVRPRKASSGGGGGGKASAAKSGGAEPCPASHWTRCGGNCYLLTSDGNNCGACGHACPRNMSLCKNGACDCSQYEKDANGGACPSS